MTTELGIQGMHCGMCARRVGDALRGVDGVSDVKVSLVESRATVAHEGPSEIEAMVGALGKAGFRATVGEQGV